MLAWKESIGRIMEEKDETWELAQQMRVCICALITAHKREDWNAFWATVEISKTILGDHIGINDDEWAVFRDDKKRPQQ